MFQRISKSHKEHNSSSSSITWQWTKKKKNKAKKYLPYFGPLFFYYTPSPPTLPSSVRLGPVNAPSVSSFQWLFLSMCLFVFLSLSLSEYEYLSVCIMKSIKFTKVWLFPFLYLYFQTLVDINCILLMYVFISISTALLFHHECLQHQGFLPLLFCFALTKFALYVSCSSVVI